MGYIKGIPFSCQEKHFIFIKKCFRIKILTLKTFINIIIPIAGWSSLVAHWVHNPKVIGSNPIPASSFVKMAMNNMLLVCL